MTYYILASFKWYFESSDFLEAFFFVVVVKDYRQNEYIDIRWQDSKCSFVLNKCKEMSDLNFLYQSPG